MSGIYGGSAEDRHFEAALDRYTDPPGEPDPGEYADWLAARRAVLVATLAAPDTLHGPSRVAAKWEILDELRCWDQRDHYDEWAAEHPERPVRSGWR